MPEHPKTSSPGISYIHLCHLTALVCKFFKIGTCTKGRKCPFVHDRDSTNVVCSCEFCFLSLMVVYLSGQCRYGDYCALPHVKPKSTNSVQSVRHKPIVSSEPASLLLPVESTSFASETPGYTPLISGPTRSAQALKSPHRNSLLSKPSTSQSTPAALPRGMFSDEEDDGVSEMPILPSLLDDLLTPMELIHLSNAREETNSKSRPAGVFSYSAMAKVGTHAPASVDVPLTSSNTKEIVATDAEVFPEDQEDLCPVSTFPVLPPDERDPLCPFAAHGNCRFGEGCRYLHGLDCPVCGKKVLHPQASSEEHQGVCLRNSRTDHIQECKERKLKLESLRDQSNVSNDSKECVVCMDVVTLKKDPRFGILSKLERLIMEDCDHCVCLECIRKWRTHETMDTSKVLFKRLIRTDMSHLSRCYTFCHTVYRLAAGSSDKRTHD